MATKTKNLSIMLEADEISDITQQVQEAVSESRIKNGAVTVFMVGSTGAISTMEYEPGLLSDIPRALERIAPSDIDYAHHNTWHDDNGKSHVRSTLIGCSLVVPFIDSRLSLGTWQQIVAMNLDTSKRERKIVLQVMGD